MFPIKSLHLASLLKLLNYTCYTIKIHNEEDYLNIYRFFSRINNFLSIDFQLEQLSSNILQDIKFLHSSSMSGSPHAILLDKNLYVEVESLKQDIINTKTYISSDQSITVSLIPDHQQSSQPISS